MIATSTQALRQWLEAAHADAAATLLSCMRPAPHRLAFGGVGICIRLGEVTPIADLVPDALLPDTVVRAVRSRRTAFVAGRLCAEYAAARFGAAEPVGIGPGGEPVWPAGLIGSITHDKRMATSVVARRADLCGVGIDSELIARGDARLAIERVCLTDWERQTWIAGAVDDRVVTLLFSAKEALYKAIYPSVRRFIDFSEVEVTELDLRGSLVLKFVDSAIAPAHPWVECQFVWDECSVHTSVLLAIGSAGVNESTTGIA